MSRRREPSPEAKARAQRIADALADLLQPTTTSAESSAAGHSTEDRDPYYGRNSGVIVDRCQTHGVFLDPGEFEAIERFIQLGGHELAAQDERDRSLKQQRRAEIERHEAAAKPTAVEHRRGAAFWGGLFSWFGD